MTDWSGEDYLRVNTLQRAMIDEAAARLAVSAGDRVLDIGCGDGYLTAALAARAPGGCAVGIDLSRRMIATARDGRHATASGPWFLVANALALPFRECFDVVASFNALHWVPDQHRALSQIASVLRPGGRAVIQMVCAGDRPSVEQVAMEICSDPRWARWFTDFRAPFVHVDPAGYGELAAAAGLTLTALNITDREWDFGDRDRFARWCAVGSTAWTDRLPFDNRTAFIEQLVNAYGQVSGRPGLFRFTQMRADLGRPPSRRREE